MTSKRRSFILLIFMIKVQKNSFSNSYFLQAKAMLSTFCVFGELVLFDLWIPDSGFWFTVPDSGFRIPVPESEFRFPGIAHQSIAHCKNVRGLGKSMVVFYLFGKYSNEGLTKFETLTQE